MIRIVGIGGTVSQGSSTERALEQALSGAKAEGATIEQFGGDCLVAMPHYGSCSISESSAADLFLRAVRQADGLILASPGYHGTISGVVKNALDYLQETAGDERPYLDNLPVGLVATAYGPQASVSTLAALRSVVHALRGWPTPFGACVLSQKGLFTEAGCSDAAVADQLETVGRQVVQFAQKVRI